MWAVAFLVARDSGGPQHWRQFDGKPGGLTVLPVNRGGA